MEGSVVVLLRTSSVARAPIYAHLRDIGLALLVVNPTPPAPEFDGVFNWWLPFDTHDVHAIDPVLRAFLDARDLTHKVAAIVSFDEYAVYPAALLATRWSLQSVPLPPEELRHVSIKSDFRAWCHSHKINAPRHVVINPPTSIMEHVISEAGGVSDPKVTPDATTPTTAEEAEKAAILASVEAQLHGLTFPVVLKPSPGAGSLLAKVCQTEQEVADHVLVMLRVLHGHPDAPHFAALYSANSAEGWSPLPPSSSASSSCLGTSMANEVDAAAPSAASAAATQATFSILAEEYVGGFEVDMDCAIEYGRLIFCAISDNFATELPYCAEQGGTCPSSLPETAQCALRDLLEDFIAAHGTRLHGVLHFEAKYDPVRQAAYVIEVNCRMGSAETDVMVRTAYRGLQLGEALVRCAMRRPLAPWIACYYPECCPPTPSRAPPHASLARGDENENKDLALLDKQGLSTSSYLPSLSPKARTTVTTITAFPTNAEGVMDARQPCSCEKTMNDETLSNDTSCTAALINAASPTLDGVLPCIRLGGPSRGYYPACAVGASVNIYPERNGTLTRVSAPVSDERLVGYSISAVPGDHVAPPPGRFYLLCWMVARGQSIDEAIKNIRALTAAFDQHVEPAA